MLTVMGIIAVVATIVAVAVQPALKKARDAKRKFELGQIGRFLAAGGNCYAPNAGPGSYDLAALFTEVTDKYPQAKAMISKVPRDPRGGSDSETFYVYDYAVTADDRPVCSLSANLENAAEPVTLTGIDQPTPGRGTGVFKAASPGRNGSDRFFQVSN
jgi:hypothetical protein